MSSNADGTVYINTELDTSGIDNGMKSLGKDIEKSTEGIGQTGVKAGEEFSKGFQEGMGDPLTEPLENQTQGIQEKMSALSGTMTKFGGAMTLAVTAPLTALGGKMVESAAEMNAMSSQFSQVFGDLEGDAATSLNKIADDTGIVEERLKGSYTSIAAFAKTTGLDTADALELSNRAMVAVADSAAFYDRSLEDTAESLRSFLKGNYENDAALGLSATETTRNAAAMELYGQAFNDLSEAQKQLTLLKMVEDANALSGALGQASRESDTWTNVTGNLNQEFTNLLGTLGQSLLPVVTPIVQFITELLQKFGELDPGIQKIIVIVGAVLAAIGPVATAIGGIISVVSTVIPIISAVIGALNPVTLVIGAVVAAIALLIANWDKVKAAMQTFMEFVRSAFEKDWTETFGVFGNVINLFFDNIQVVWNAIKGVFEGIITFVKGVFSGDWNKAWEGIKKIFSSIFNGILETSRNIIQTLFTVITGVVQKIKDRVSSVFNALKDGIAWIWNGIVTHIKNTVNGILYVINSLIGGVVNGINNVIRVLNGLKFSIPDWIPGVGGKSFGLNIGYLSAPQIPYLATGAVIPPNAPFLAMLGDQKHGTNIEAPLSTIESALDNVLNRRGGTSGSMTLHNVMQVNRRVLYDEFIEEAKLRMSTTGRNPFDLA